MLIKSADRYVHRLTSGALVYVGPIGAFLDNIQADVIQGPMGIQGPSGNDGDSIPKPYFKATLSSPENTGAASPATVFFDTLIDNYNAPGFDIVNYQHKPENINAMELWHYDVMVQISSYAEMVLEVYRNDGLTLVAQSHATIEPSLGFSFSLPWSSDDDPIIVRLTTPGNEVITAADWQGYRAGFLETEPAPGGESGTEDAQVSSGPDDAHQAADDSGFNHSAVTLRVEPSTSAASRWNCGMRFVLPNVPQGATITAAWLEVVFPVGQRDSPRLTISGELIADAPDFATNQTVNGRTLTTANTPWSGDDLGSGIFIQSPDISGIVQEIVNQPAWAPDNGVAIIAIADSVTGPEATRFTPFDSDPASACKLHVEWQTP